MPERTRLDLMRETCAALWGPNWKTEFRKVIGCAPGTIQRWINGNGAPRPRVSAALYPIVETRIEQLQRLSNELRRDSQGE